MKGNQNFPHFSLLLSLVALLASSCSGMIAQTQKKDPIRIYYAAWPGDYPLVLADALGYYEKHGVEVELHYLETYNDGLIKFINHQVDTMNTNLVDALLIAQDKDIQIVWLQDNSLDTLVSTQSVTSTLDLRGKRIGVDIGAGLGELFIENVLRTNLMTMQDVTLVKISSEEIPTALGNQIDVGFTWSPYTDEALASGHKILIQLPSNSPDVMVFNTSFIEERPEDVKALVEAWSEAVMYWEANPTQSTVLFANFYGVNPEELSLGVDEGVDSYTRQQNKEAFTPSFPGSIYEAARINLEYLVRTGGIRRLPDITRLFNNDFIGKLEDSN